MFEPFQKFLTVAANRYNIGTQIQAAQVCQQFRKLIPTLFPQHPEAANNIKPGYYKDKILVINTAAPGWSQEVIMRKVQIIEAVNAEFGKEVVKNIRTQLFS